jgi:hypothetical protein
MTSVGYDDLSDLSDLSVVEPLLPLMTSQKYFT